MNKSLVALVCMGAVLWGCSGSDQPAATTTGGSTPTGGAKPQIAVIPKGSTHVFWKAVEAGAKKAGEEAGVEVIWKGPIKEDDRDSQIKTVEEFVTKGVQGICLAPLDDTALRAPVKDAQDKGIPVLIFDSALKDDNTISFVATDNKAAGKMGGEKLAALLGGKGKVILMRYQEGSASTAEREEGFLEAMKANPGIEVVSDNQYAGATVETAQATAENLLSKFPAGKFDGVFTPNESSTFGMLRALQGASLAGKVKFVGFDSSEPLYKGLVDGLIHALVVQNPEKMGYLAVKTMAAHLKKEKIEKRIDTGAAVVAKEDLTDPEKEKLVKPQQ